MAVERLSRDCFPFLSLPRELQMSILCYTDLVTPLSSVRWDPHDKYHLGIERVQSCHPRNGAVCGPPYDQCHPDNHVNCRGLLPPLGNVAKVCKGSDYCLCRHACEARAERGMASCRSCTHYACQFLPPRRETEGHDASSPQDPPRFDTPDPTFPPCPGAHWTPPIPLFLVSRAFRNVSSAVFFGCNHFKVSCNNFKALMINVDSDGYLQRFRDDRVTRSPSPSSRAGPSIFLCDILPKDARPFLRDLEIDLLDIADYAAMQEWLCVAQEIGPQLRLKVLRLHGESPHDGLQDVAEWRGQDAAESVRLAREEVAAWMWPPLKEGAAAVAGGQDAKGRLELFKAKISCTSGEIHDTVWYSIVGPARVDVDESVPQWCHDLYYDDELVMPDWCYHVRVDMEPPPRNASTSLRSKSGFPTRERWVEDIMVSCREPDYGFGRRDSDNAE